MVVVHALKYICELQSRARRCRHDVNLPRADRDPSRPPAAERRRQDWLRQLCVWGWPIRGAYLARTPIHQ